MKIGELIETSSTCDTRLRHEPLTPAPDPGGAVTTSGADVRTAAAALRRAGAQRLLVLDDGGFVGVVTVEDLLRGALATDDRQLCHDLTRRDTPSQPDRPARSR